MKTSRYSGFYKLPVADRQREIMEFAGISQEEMDRLNTPLDMEIADHMVENVIGRYALPMGVAVNFLINDKDYVIPMVTEEASVIAGCTNAAHIARACGGVYTSSTKPVMIAQIQLINVGAPENARLKILENKEEILSICNRKDPYLVAHGGGAEDIEVRVLDSMLGKIVVVHLLVNTLDAMGANAVNTMAEAVAAHLEQIAGGQVVARILSNLATHRLARARVLLKKEILGGEDIVKAMWRVYAFAEADPYRAATHNKGIMNGISAVVTATGNDTRGIEAGAHAYAAMSGQYRSLTKWEITADGDLAGSIELPMAVGLVGGASKTQPQAQVALKMIGAKTATELGEVIAAVGLIQNLVALKVLGTEGVQRGHMSLHARNLASAAGAKGEILDKVVARMIADQNIHLEYAQELLKEYENK